MDCEDEIYSGTLKVNRKLCHCVLTNKRLFWKAYNNFNSSIDIYKPGFPIICSDELETIFLSEMVMVHELDVPNNQSNNFSGKVSSVFGRNTIQSPNEFNWEAVGVRRGNNFKWRPRSVLFSTTSVCEMQQWIAHIQRAIDSHGLAQRPKNLLVFINPIGGLKKGPLIYSEKVAPLFALAGIKTNVIVTQRAKHAKDILLEEDLTLYDGVVCVGGDGMFSELAHGLLLRANQYTDGSFCGPVKTIRAAQLRIGLIPAGSTDAVAYSVMGTNDPVTAALHIILGDDISTDVMSVHSDGQFLCYTVSMLGYGFYGDLIADSESHRWMGPLRYDWLGLKKFLCNNAYYGDVEYLESENTTSHPQDGVRCGASCSVCENESSNIEGEWQSVSDKFMNVSASLITCRCNRSPAGASPYAHLSDGCVDLTLVRKCSRPDFLRHLLRMADPIADQFNLPHVTVKRVKAFRFIPRFERKSSLSSHNTSHASFFHSTMSNLDQESGIVLYSSEQSPVSSDQDSPPSLESSSEKTHSRQSSDAIFDDCMPAPPLVGEAISINSRDVSMWNCDGEVLEGARPIECRVHRKMIRIFARGIEFSPAFLVKSDTQADS